MWSKCLNACDAVKLRDCCVAEFKVCAASVATRARLDSLMASYKQIILSITWSLIQYKSRIYLHYGTANTFNLLEKLAAALWKWDQHRLSMVQSQKLIKYRNGLFERGANTAEVSAENAVLSSRIVLTAFRWSLTSVLKTVSISRGGNSD